MIKIKTLTLFFIFTLSALFLLQTPAQALYRTSENLVELAEDEVIDDDVFLSAGTVNVRGTINGDLYVMGGTIEINGTVNGDVLGAGGTIILSGQVTEDVRMAGGTITITSTEIGDDLNLAGGSLSIDRESTVGGSLAAAGGSLVNQADIGSHFVVGAGSVSLNGSVGGDAEIGAGSLTIGSGVTIGGNLRYPVETEAQISDTASISGSVEQVSPEFGRTDIAHVGERAEEAGAFLAGINLTLKIWSFFAALLVGFLILYLLPTVSTDIALTLKEQFLQSILVGFLIFVLAGPLFIMLLITIIGIPLALILLAKYLIDLYLTKLVVGLAVGLALKDQFEWTKVNTFIALTIGLLIYYLLNLIPVVSFFVSLLTIFAGLGAIYIWIWNWYKNRKV